MKLKWKEPQLVTYGIVVIVIGILSAIIIPNNLPLAMLVSGVSSITAYGIIGLYKGTKSISKK